MRSLDFPAAELWRHFSDTKMFHLKSVSFEQEENWIMGIRCKNANVWNWDMIWHVGGHVSSSVSNTIVIIINITTLFMRYYSAWKYTLIHQNPIWGRNWSQCQLLSLVRSCWRMSVERWWLQMNLTFDPIISTRWAYKLGRECLSSFLFHPCPLEMTEACEIYKNPFLSFFSGE